MEALACTKAFTDDRGNRFVYPSMIRWPQDDEADRPSKCDLILQAMTLDLALGTKADTEWFEFDPTIFPHVKMDILHRNFAHGGATVMCFAGPVFEQVCSEQADPSSDVQSSQSEPQASAGNAGLDEQSSLIEHKAGSV